jgi:superfamily II DNA or RNA helicase
MEEKRFITKQLSFLMPNAYFIPSVRAGFQSPYKQFFKIHQDLIVIPKGITPLLIKSFEQEQIQYIYNKIEYSDIKQPSFDEFKTWINDLKIPFEPYDYQVQAAFDSIINKKQINLMATGSGKSLTIYLLIRWFLKNNLKSIIVVPSIMLVNQLKTDFNDYGWSINETDKLIKLIGGDHKLINKELDFPITITTWQSIYKSADLFSTIDALIIDEVHTAKADSFDKIIFPSTPNTIYKLGFTGTLPKDAIDKMTIISSMGPDIRYITTKGLIDRGLATPALIKAIFLKYNEIECKLVKNMKYQDEVKYFSEHKKRNMIIAKMANKFSQEVGKGNTLVLFDRKEHGKQLALDTFKLKYNRDIDTKELMKADNPFGIYYLVGEVKGKEREAIRKLLETSTNCIVFGTSSILSTGINIKNLHNLMLVSGGKSSIKLHQSIGRLLRTHASKDMVYIWDIIDDCSIIGKSSTHKNYYMKHFLERLVEYMDAEYPIEEKVINL